MTRRRRIPNVAHFVFGLREQREEFHFTQYLAIESCRRMLEPDVIYFHHLHMPWGPWWDRVANHVELRPVDLVPEVSSADYSNGTVPAAYRYAHHADFIRLDALIEHGGVYADIDTIFVRPFPARLFERRFVIGAEPPVVDERTGETRRSLCNALLMAEPGSSYARAWRERMAAELNGTWSNHSGFLSHRLSEQMTGEVDVEPPVTFFSFGSDPDGLARLFEQEHAVPPEALSIHLWAHLWWRRSRRDFSRAHAAWCTPSVVRRARTTFAELARPYLDDADAEADADAGADAGAHATARVSTPGPDNWVYLSLDETSGYGVAADRCRGALESSGIEVDWAPLVPGGAWGLGYEIPAALDPLPTASPGQVVVAHLVAEYFPEVRARSPDAVVVGHTVWDTDRIPAHWVACIDAADLIVVPSRFSAAAVVRATPATPVAIVPHVAPAVITDGPGLPDDVNTDAFVFYTIAEWNERKAVFLTIEAFLQAFTSGDNVLMVVKTSHHDHRVAPPAGRRAVEPGTSAWALARLMARHRDPPPVRLVTRHLDDDDIAALHRRGDCFTSLCRGEGWGLGGFDAAAYGNPVVTTGYGGHLDYLGGSPYLVHHTLVPVHDPAGFPSYAPDQRWAEPDLAHAVDVLRAVHARPREAADHASALATDIRTRYRPEAVASTFRQAVASRRAGGGAAGGHVSEPASSAP